MRVAVVGGVLKRSRAKASAVGIAMYVSQDRADVVRMPSQKLKDPTEKC